MFTVFQQEAGLRGISKETGIIPIFELELTFFDIVRIGKWSTDGDNIFKIVKACAIQLVYYCQFRTQSNEYEHWIETGIFSRPD